MHSVNPPSSAPPHAACDGTTQTIAACTVRSSRDGTFQLTKSVTREGRRVAVSSEAFFVGEYNDKDQWVGCVSDADLVGVDLDRATCLTGPAGSVTIHNCRTIRGSKPNTADVGRPLLLNTFSAADAFPYTNNPLGSRSVSPSGGMRAACSK